MHSLSRVASIQARLVLLRAQWALQRVAVKAALGIVGLIFLIVSLVMLHGGAFVGIEGQLGTMCAYFIMGGIDLVVAAGFAAGAYLVYGEADPDSETDSEPDGEEPRP